MEDIDEQIVKPADEKDNTDKDQQGLGDNQYKGHQVI
jgi:hypothetical protein